MSENFYFVELLLVKSIITSSHHSTASFRRPLATVFEANHRVLHLLYLRWVVCISQALSNAISFFWLFRNKSWGYFLDFQYLYTKNIFVTKSTLKLILTYHISKVNQPFQRDKFVKYFMTTLRTRIETCIAVVRIVWTLALNPFSCILYYAQITFLQ